MPALLPVSRDAMAPSYPEVATDFARISDVAYTEEDAFRRTLTPHDDPRHRGAQAGRRLRPARAGRRCSAATRRSRCTTRTASRSTSRSNGRRGVGRREGVPRAHDRAAPAGPTRSRSAPAASTRPRTSRSRPSSRRPSGDSSGTPSPCRRGARRRPAGRRRPRAGRDGPGGTVGVRPHPSTRRPAASSPTTARSCPTAGRPSRSTTCSARSRACRCTAPPWCKGTAALGHRDDRPRPPQGDQPRPLGDAHNPRGGSRSARMRRRAGSENAPGRRLRFRRSSCPRAGALSEIEERVDAQLQSRGHGPAHADHRGARPGGDGAVRREVRRHRARRLHRRRLVARALRGHACSARAAQASSRCSASRRSASGVRRVDALVGDGAYGFQAKGHALVGQLTGLLNVRTEELPDRVSALVSRLRNAERDSPSSGRRSSWPRPARSPPGRGSWAARASSCTTPAR